MYYPLRHFWTFSHAKEGIRSALIDKVEEVSVRGIGIF